METSCQTMIWILVLLLHADMEKLTQVLLHARQIFWFGYEKVCIQTVDTDVLVIAIARYFQTGLKELWVELGVGHS